MTTELRYMTKNQTTGALQLHKGIAQVFKSSD